MNKLLIGLLCWGVLTTISCKTVQVTEQNPTPAKKSVKFLLRQLEKQQFNYKWLGCRAKIKVDGEEEHVVFSAALRLQKDSLIWMRIKKMNVEGARIKITPTSIEILNRQESEYIKRPFSFIKEKYGLDITFAQLQDALVGNPILYKDRTLLSEVEGKALSLKTPPNQKEIVQLLLRANDFLLEELRGSVNANHLSIHYSDYITVQQQQIATKKRINIDSKEVGKIDIDVTFSGITIDEVQKVGFAIPTSYKRL